MSHEPTTQNVYVLIHNGGARRLSLGKQTVQPGGWAWVPIWAFAPGRWPSLSADGVTEHGVHHDTPTTPLPQAGPSAARGRAAQEAPVSVEAAEPATPSPYPSSIPAPAQELLGEMQRRKEADERPLSEPIASPLPRQETKPRVKLTMGPQAPDALEKAAAALVEKDGLGEGVVSGSEWSREELEELDRDDLLEIAQQAGVEPKGNKATLIKRILDGAGEEAGDGESTVLGD